MHHNNNNKWRRSYQLAHVAHSVEVCGVAAAGRQLAPAGISIAV